MNTDSHIQTFRGIYTHLQTCTVRKKYRHEKYIQNIYILWVEKNNYC